MNYHLLFKILLVGDTEVGKSALLHPPFEPSSSTSTIGPEFLKKTVEIDRKKIKLQIWNITGQESSQAQITSYYRDALGFILVYDVTDEPSFNRISDWLSIIEQHAREKDFKKLLFGSKSHCWCEETRQITTKRGQEYAREHGMRFVESADLDEAINFIAKDILNKDHQQPLFGRSKLLCDFDK